MRPLALGLFFLLFLAVGLSVWADADMATAEKLLRDKDWSKRVAGLVALESLGGDRAERLAKKALEDEDWDVQLRAIQTLGTIGKDAARKALIRKCIEGEVEVVRLAAARALRKLDPARSAERLLDLARRAKGSHQKAFAIQAAGELLTADLFTKVRPLSKQKDLEGQAAAVRALGKFASYEDLREDVFKILDKTLKRRDDNKYFLSYVAAIHAFGAFDLDEVRTRLVQEILVQPDDDPYAPERIARVLQRWDAGKVTAAVTAGFASAKKPAPRRRLVRLCARLGLRDAKDVVQKQLAHKDERVRAEAARTLGLIGDASCRKALEPLLEDKGELIAIEAVTALARVLPPAEFRALGKVIRAAPSLTARLQFVVEVADNTPGEDAAVADAAIDAILPFTEDKRWRVATAAIVTVGTLGLGKDLPKIENFAKSKKWRVRAAAFEACGRLRAIESVPLLAKGLDDRDPVVRGVCHANLQILLRKKFKPDRELWEDYWAGSKQGVELIKRSRRTVEEKKVDAERAERNKAYGDSLKTKDDKDPGVEILQKARILVISGAWDKVEVVLDHLYIEHTLLRAQELKDVGLNPNQIVLINCEGNIDKGTAQRLRWFTNVGGYVMTTDWALTKAVRVSFPGYIEQSSRSSTGNDVVVVEEALPGHPLTKGVFDGVAALKWWLEIQAFPIAVPYPERCDVIVDSAQMRQRYGSSTMAAVFRWGLGKVQHSVSHFYLQEEGMQHLSGARERMIFAHDHLGLDLPQIRGLQKKGAFSGSLNEAVMREIAPDYSMFRLIVNMVAEKSAWVEGL